ncbi:MAG: ATP-binding protein [Streptosporangiaceae bacterium]
MPDPAPRGAGGPVEPVGGAAQLGAAEGVRGGMHNVSGGPGFPREKSLRAFDFEANPDIDPAVIHQLATCEWVKKGEPLCLIGDSGTGCPRPSPATAGSTSRCWTSRATWPSTSAGPSCCSKYSPSGGDQQHRHRLQRIVEWTNTFTDPRLCAAIVDRLTFGGSIIQTGTRSYRLEHARAAATASK